MSKQVVAEAMINGGPLGIELSQGVRVVRREGLTFEPDRTSGWYDAFIRGEGFTYELEQMGDEGWVYVPGSACDWYPGDAKVDDDFLDCLVEGTEIESREWNWSWA